MRVELRTNPSLYTSIYKLIVPESNGNFRVQGLIPGSYYVYYNTVHDSAFLAEWYNDTVSPTQASPIALTSGTTTTVNATLARGGVIVGDLTISPTVKRPNRIPCPPK